MRNQKWILFITSLMLASCFDKDYDLHRFQRYTYTEGTVLTFESDASTEQFTVDKIVNGRYHHSRTGTCGKQPFELHEYQVVYLRPIDSVEVTDHYIGDFVDDCTGHPRRGSSKLISSITTTFSPDHYASLTWLDEFQEKMSSYVYQHPKITIGSKTFNNVMEYDVKSNKRLSKLYYSTQKGFVGFTLLTGETFALVSP